MAKLFIKKVRFLHNNSIHMKSLVMSSDIATACHMHNRAGHVDFVDTSRPITCPTCKELFDSLIDGVRTKDAY